MHACQHVFCPLCYSNVRGRSNYKGHKGYRKSPSDKAVSIMAILRKVVTSREVPPDLGCWVAPDGSELMPALREFLTLAVWEDGTDRVPGTMVAFVDGGMVKVLLNDKDADRVAVVSAKSLYAAMEAADEHLTMDALDWRRSRPQGGGRGVKK